MFTLKFIQHLKDGAVRQNAISCPHYEVITDKHKTVVIAFKDFRCVDGVEYVISEKIQSSSSDTGYSVCFIENSSGKTIDRINSVD